MEECPSWAWSSWLHNLLSFLLKIYLFILHSNISPLSPQYPLTQILPQFYPPHPPTNYQPPLLPPQTFTSQHHPQSHPSPSTSSHCSTRCILSCWGQARGPGFAVSQTIREVGSRFRDSLCSSCWGTHMKTKLHIWYIYAEGLGPACAHSLVGGGFSLWEPLRVQVSWLCWSSCVVLILFPSLNPPLTLPWDSQAPATSRDVELCISFHWLPGGVSQRTVILGSCSKATDSGTGLCFNCRGNPHEDRAMKLLSMWRVPRSRPCLFICWYRTQDHLPRVGTTHQPPTSTINQKMHRRFAHRLRAFFSWGPLFPNDSSLCQVDTN
jgi:hypothetical protein